MEVTVKKSLVSDIDLKHEIESVKNDSDEITVFLSKTLSGYIYLVIDCSKSMSGEKLNSVKEGAKNFVLNAKAKSYLVGLIKFDSGATLLIEPQTDLRNIYHKIDELDTDGTTNMTDAIIMASEKLERQNGARIMIIATDGMPDNKEAALKAAVQAKKKKIEIIALGTDDADEEFLKQIASSHSLGIKVSRNLLGKAIVTTAKMLKRPGG